MNTWMTVKTSSDGNVFTKKHLLLFVLIIIGVGLRWYALASRPLHHDEALHAFYGYYFSQSPEDNYYKYNPLLHGPVLYHLMCWTYQLFPFSKFTSRLPIAVIGTLLLFVPLLFRRFFSPHALIALTAMLATSTTMIFWSRFLRHDLLVVLWWAIAAYAVLLGNRRIRIVLVGIAMTLQICTKENSYVTLAILLGFFIFEAISRLFLHDNQGEAASTTPSLCRQTVRYLCGHPMQVLVAGLLCLTLFVYFFSGGFRYGLGDIARDPGNVFVFIGDIIRNSFGYWWHQHQLERIPGPFAYTIYIISWYDFAVVLLFVVHLVSIGFRSKGNFRTGFYVLFGGCGLLTIICLTYPPEDFPDLWLIRSSLGHFLKLKNGLDVICFAFLICYAPYLTLFHLARKEVGLAFSGYFFLANLFAYCYLGEKVPWLALYPLILGCVYLTLYFDPILFRQELQVTGNRAVLSRRLGFANGYWPVVVCLLLVYNIYTVWLVMGVHRGINGELISLNHTTELFDRIITRIKNQMILPENGQAQFLVTGEAIWPSSAYMLGEKRFHFVAEGKETTRFDWIVGDTAAQIDQIRPGYRKRQIPLRARAKVDYNHIKPIDFFVYLLSHRLEEPAQVTGVWLGCRLPDSICDTLPAYQE